MSDELVDLIMKKLESFNYSDDGTIIDRFVEFLIKENCEGCEECEPRLDSDFYPGMACLHEGECKWMLDCAEQFKTQYFESNNKLNTK